jgi:hypothetical protein
MNDLDRELDRLARKLPDWAAKTIRWVRRPTSAWVRYPLALLLIAGGFVGFLPILGFWMVPLGLVLVAEDVPFLQRPLARLIRWINDRWERRGGSDAPAPAAVRHGNREH